MIVQQRSSVSCVDCNVDCGKTVSCGEEVDLYHLRRKRRSDFKTGNAGAGRLDLTTQNIWVSYGNQISVELVMGNVAHQNDAQ